MRDYTQLNETYHYQLGDGLFVLDAFVDVELQRLAAHGIEKELLILWEELVIVGLDDGLSWLDVLCLAFCSSATTRGTSWCHGSWSAETESVSSLERPAYFGADARRAHSTYWQLLSTRTTVTKI